MSESVCGVLVLDKPRGLSSAAAVNQVKAALGVRRAGHAGTLDPMATGVLVVCIGEATKIATYLLLDDKRYLATARLGEATNTWDADGMVVERAPVPPITDPEVRSVLARFVGNIEQTPPAYSALKQGGQPLYRRARRGETVTPPTRTVEVHAVELVSWSPPDLTFRVDCGKGTYVRSLAVDIARALGTVAHLIALRRERSGQFSLANSVPWPPRPPTQVEVQSPTQVGVEVHDDDPTRVEVQVPKPTRVEVQVPKPTQVEIRQRLARGVIAPAEALSGLTRVEVDAAGEGAIRRGQAVAGGGAEGEMVRLVGVGGQLVAVGQLRQGRIWPVRVLHPHG